MDEETKELMLYAVECHNYLNGAVGQNYGLDGELKRVVELNGGKLKPLEGRSGTWALCKELN